MVYRKTPEIKAHLKSQRDLIIEAATAVVAKGRRDRILALTVEKANISMGTVYQHFADVEEMWNAVVATALARDLASIREAASRGDQNAADVLSRAIMAFYERLAEPRLARELATVPAYRRGIRGAFEPFLEAMGLPPRARELRAGAIFGALYGLADAGASGPTAAAICLTMTSRWIVAAE